MDQRTPEDAQVYQQAYAAVLNNPYWYGDRPRLLNETFNAENTQKRADILIDVLRRAARRRTEHHLSQQYSNLADKLSFCRLDHCGSSACLKCLRAFQQAKTVAHRRIMSQLAIMLSQNTLVHCHNYSAGTKLSTFNSS